MMIDMENLRAEFAATIFFRECARQYARLYPGRVINGEMPIQTLAAYPVPHQRIMVEAVKKAVEASTGMNELFERFVQEKRELAALNGQPF